MGVTELIFELLVLKAKLKIKGVFRGYTVTMVTSYTKKMVTVCRPMIGHLLIPLL